MVQDLDTAPSAKRREESMDSSDSGEVLLAISEKGDRSDAVEVTTLSAAGLLERSHLQEWVVAHPTILGSGVMIVTVEYDAWVVAGDSQPYRLDVLGLDSDGRLVVAELKRGVAPDTVEMQVIKYAAMASRFRLESLAAAHASFCSARGTIMTAEQAAEALQAHAETVSDETLADPRVVVIAQGFSPVVISSVVWLAQRGVDISLVRFQPYQHSSGQVFVTFSRLYPLPDIEKSIVAPGTPAAAISTEKLPVVEWTVSDLIALGRVANVTTRTALDLCSERAGDNVSLTAIVDAGGITRDQAKGQLAGLTMVTKRRFARRNWPFSVAWAADGTPQAFYTMSTETAALWQQAAIQLDAEQSDATTPDGVGPLLPPEDKQ
jgi:hypothetical protein